MTVIQILENVSQGKYDSRLLQGEMRVFGPNNLAVIITSVNSNQPMARRFVTWAFSRILVTMHRDTGTGYHPGIFEPRWQGRKTGTITIAFGRPPSNQPSSSSITMTSSSQTRPQARNATTMLGNDGVAWIYSPDHSNPPMTMWDIALGTVGALN